jgi:hypothetical protein
VIACPACGSDRVQARDAYPDEPEIMAATCQAPGCGASFDVRVTAAGVELAPVTYHGPSSGWDGPPHIHREGAACVLCDLAAAADAADAGEPPEGW